MDRGNARESIPHRAALRGMLVPRHARQVIAAALVLSCLVLSPPVHAAPPASTPQRVWAGIYVLDAYELNIKSSSYRLDFFLWFRWKGKFDPDRFELMNGRDLVTKRTDKREVNGFQYAQYRCQGEFHADFDMSRYPLDRHALVIEVEDESRESKELVYVPDKENTRLDPRVHLGGWTLGQRVARVVDASHASNYGMPGRRQSDTLVFSRLLVEIPITHAGTGIYLKNFLPVFISVMIAFLSIIIPTRELGPRLDSGLAGTFGVVASHMAGSQNLPETPYFTLADKLHVASLMFVFLSLLVTCIVYLLGHKGRVAAGQRLNLVMGFLLIAGYLLTVTVLTGLRV